MKLFSEFKEELRQEFRTLKETLVRDFRSDIREVRSDVREIKSSMEFMNKTFEDIRKNMETIMSENAALREENQALREKYDSVEKVIKETGIRLTQCEQYSRNHNVEIKGIAESEGENLPELLGALGRFIGEPISLSDVEICHRVPTRNAGASNIVVQFQRRLKRDSVLEKARGKKRILTRDLGLSSSEPVYVNEHLCPTMKRLLGMAVSRKRERKWKYVWVRGGRIYARQSESAPVMPITHEDDLARIC